MKWLWRWKYAREVKRHYGFIMWPLGKMANVALRQAFPNLGVLKYGYDKGDSPQFSAVLLATTVVGRIIETISPDARRMALHALSTSNESNALANNLVAILDAATALGAQEAELNAMKYEMVGALEGYTADQRERYRMQRAIDDLIPGSTGQYEAPHNP